MDATASGRPPGRAEEARARTVSIAGTERPFAEITAPEARAQAEELKGAGTWGPLQRVAKVALAWAELARMIDEAGVATVGELDDETVLRWAERVWVIAPETGMI
jgi:hypothetical protein